MEFADRQGIVVIDETAAVGLSLSLMGGVQGEAPANVWEGLDTHAAHEESIRQLIRRDGIRRTKDEENCEPNTLRSACALSKMPGASMSPHNLLTHFSREQGPKRLGPVPSTHAPSASTWPTLVVTTFSSMTSL